MSGKILQREAFPVLDLIAAKKAVDHLAAAVCVFRYDRMTIGQLFIPETNEDDIVVHYVFASPHVESNPTSIVLKIKEINNSIDNHRISVFCPRCEGHYFKLYYVDTWACATCHGLHYRRQLVDKEVLKWERLDQLEQTVGRGRPKGMHSATYAALREEHFRLKWKLEGKARKYASEAHDLAINAEWVAGSTIDFWSTQYAIRGRNFVRIGD